MTTKYCEELDQLSDAYDAARSMDVHALCAAVQDWLRTPMIMVGSGGSFSTASYAAYLHECASGQLARAATPLELVSSPIPRAGVACFSASGRNRDIVSAFRAAARQEVDPLAALVLADASPLHNMGSRNQYANLVSLPHPAFADGFLAVASLLASALLLLRAYRAAMGQSEKDVPDSLDALISDSTSFTEVAEISPFMDSVTERPFVSVLYTQPLSPAAIDLESRFVEAALGPLHIADLRNFGHGRHVWLAKRAAETGVLALIGDEQAALGKKTLALLPDATAVARVRFSGPTDLQALAGLVVGLYMAESAGRSAAIDPGRPGVPAFGRALYRLTPHTNKVSQTSINQAAAIRRKGGISDTAWIERYRCAIDRINRARFGALVADYDGTLCDTRSRFDPLPRPIAVELTRLCECGAYLGIATGRGPSAGKELRDALPQGIHDRILVGYYNCAEIRPLTDKTDPLLESLDCTHPMVAAIFQEPLFAGVDVRANEAQISITLNTGLFVDEAVMHTQGLLRALNIEGNVVASSHSIDVLIKGQSKCDIIGALEQQFDLLGPCLRVGDRGRWPGNDADLLDDPLGLSVDEVSRHAENGWSLAPAGVKGIQATLFYFRRLLWSNRGGQIKLTLGARQ